MAQFLGLAQNVNLPTMPITTLNVNALQNMIDMQIQTLDMYCAALLNAQNLILFSTNQPAPAATARPTVKINKPKFDGTPREKAQAFITACTTYQTLRPGDFPRDKVFIMWALTCISNESKAASWKAHWLTLWTQNINAGTPQPLTLTDWDTFSREFLGKFLDPLEQQRKQQYLIEMRQKTSCQDHTQDFNRTALLAGMTGNNALLWLYWQSLKAEIQWELLREMFNTLEVLQSAAINTDDLLFLFKKQHQDSHPHKPQQKPKQIEYHPQAQPSQGGANQG
jgi:hypothetical protein